MATVVEDKLTNFKDHCRTHDSHEHGDTCLDGFDSEREARRHTEQKTRKCLLCREFFPSAWAGERICRKCKSTSTWRSSGME